MLEKSRVYEDGKVVQGWFETTHYKAQYGRIDAESSLNGGIWAIAGCVAEPAVAWAAAFAVWGGFGTGAQRRLHLPEPPRSSQSVAWVVSTKEGGGGKGWFRSRRRHGGREGGVASDVWQLTQVAA